MNKILYTAGFLIIAGLTLAGVYLIDSEKTDTNEYQNDSQIVTKGVVVDMSNQNLSKVPSSVFNRTEIEELHVSNNGIEGSLQAEVRQLQNLKVLNLSNNLFTGVPAEIGQLKNLEILDLSYNKLTGLPYELGNLSQLKILNLKGNKYSTQDLEIIKQKLPATTVVLVD